MTHYIVGIEDKKPLREAFNATFEGALKSFQRMKQISVGAYAVEGHEFPLGAVSSLLSRNARETGSLSTVVADFVMVNSLSPVSKDTRPSLYLLHDQFTKDVDTFARVPLIIVYSGKPAGEITSDQSFRNWVESAQKGPVYTPAIGYRGKTGDIQGDIIDLFKIVRGVDAGVKAAGSVDAYRVQLHERARSARYVLSGTNF